MHLTVGINQMYLEPRRNSDHQIWVKSTDQSHERKSRLDKAGDLLLLANKVTNILEKKDA